MNEKIKVIIVAPISLAYFSKVIKKPTKTVILGDWHARTAFRLKAAFPELDVECWSPKNNRSAEESFTKDSVTFRMFPSTYYRTYGMELSLPLITALRKEAKNKNTIIEVHEIHNTNGLLIPLLVNGNLLVQHHGGVSFVEHAKRRKLRLMYPLIYSLELLQRIGIKKVKRYFSLSDVETKYIQKISPNTKVLFLTMGVKDDYFKRVDKKTARKKLKINQNKKIAIHIGRLSKLKGVDYVLKGLKELNDQNLEYHLIGEGPDRKEFEKYASKNKINAVFHGYISEEKKKLLIDAADFLILASNREGCPVVIMEALAKNLPVIASNVGGVSKMIKNGREGFIIRPKNIKDIVTAIKKMLKNPPKNVYKYADKYNWNHIIEKRVKEYESLLNKKII